jgi:hypothetical protein
MAKSSYIDVQRIQLRLPIGIYEELVHIMKTEKKWSSPQQFIQDALNEKIEKWKKDHTELTGHP